MKPRTREETKEMGPSISLSAKETHWWTKALSSALDPRRVELGAREETDK